MGSLVPDRALSRSNTKPVSLAARKKLLTQALYNELQQVTQLGDGSLTTKMQALACGMVDIALNAESNTDRIAASKLIFDRLEGKAAVQQEQNVQEMPKIQIVVGDVSEAQLIKQANENLSPEEKENYFVEVSDEDGGKSERFSV